MGEKPVEMGRSGAKGLMGPVKTVDEFKGRDPRVDYKTGTNYNDAVALLQASSPKEERKYLAQQYGNENVFQDKGGTFYVKTPDGKLVAPGTAGFMRNAMAYLQADAPTAVGAAGGAAVGGIPGAMVGGAAGKGITELYKMARGRFEKTPSETALDVGVTGLGAGAGQAVGGAISSAPRAAVQGWRRYLSGTTPEAAETTMQTARYGGVPPISSSAPEAKAMQWHQAFGEKLFGSQIEKRNVQAMEKQAREVLEASGLRGPQLEQAAREVFETGAATSSRAVDAAVGQRTVAVAKQMEGEVQRLAAEADKRIASDLQRLQAIPRRAPAGDLGAGVADAVSTARSEFGRTASKIYSRVDQLAGGEPVVPTGPIMREAGNLLRAMPKSAEGQPIFGDAKVMQTIQNLAKLDDRVTFADAQRIRTLLGEMALSPDLTPGIPKREFGRLRDAVNAAFSLAARDPRAAPAVNMLRTADKFYAEGIKKFEDATVNRLVQQARGGMAPDPGVIASQVLKPEYTARARELRNMVGAQVWRRVATADFDNILREAIEPATRQVDARKLANAIAERRGLLDITYGPAIARDLTGWSERVAARGGKIPASQLKPDTFGQTMRGLEAAQTKLDGFLKDNFIAALSKPGKMQDGAVGFLARPGQEARLAQALKFFGENSPEIQLVRQQFLKDILHASVKPTASGAGKTIKGNTLMDALKPYSMAQQRMLMPGGLDDDVRLIAKNANFLFPEKGSDMSAGLAAGAVKAALPFGAITGGVPGALAGGALALKVAGVAWLTNAILSSPTTARVIAQGLREGGPKAKATREAVHYLMRSGGTAFAEKRKPRPQGEMSPEAR
ncbi:MAG: hypothetical protein AABZ67_00515 [Pseudomonadota bacterium]